MDMTNRHINFTKAALNALPFPPAYRRTVVHDLKIRGLQLRVTPTGVKTFSVFRRIKGGRPERLTLGKFPAMSIEGARRAAAKINAAIEDRQNPAEIKRSLREEQTFGQLFEEYLERHSKPRKRRWQDDKSKYAKYVEKSMGSKKISSIGRSDIASMHSVITRGGHPTTANRVLALISSIFSWAISVGSAEKNPVSGIRRNPERSRDRFLHAHELPRFFRSLALEPNTTMRDFFLMCLLTGARRENVLHMQWRDISLDRAEWRIPRTKNGLPQLVTLSSPAVEVLKARHEITEINAAGKGQKDKSGTQLEGGTLEFKQRNEYVFPSHRANGPIVETRKAWERLFDRDELAEIRERLQQRGIELPTSVDETLARALCQARALAAAHHVDTTDARLTDLRVHDLRRTLGSWQAMLGTSLAIIGKSLNHKSVQATMIYARLEQDPVRESVERAATAILSAAGVQRMPAPVVLERKKALR